MAIRRALTDFLILIADEERSGSVSSAHQRLIRAPNLVPQREGVVPVRSHFDFHGRGSPPEVFSAGSQPNRSARVHGWLGGDL